MKKIFTISILLVFIRATNLFAQHNAIPKQRPADYEYLSAPDSLGFRTPLKMPSSSRSNNQILPYPIIFIHGLTSNSDSCWRIATNFMDAQYGTTFGGRFDYCLNEDNDNYLANTDFSPAPNADLVIFNGTWNVGDYYYVNFDVNRNGQVPTAVLSNQAAITKQGAVLSDAIARVLQITGRDKVILMGHSMGGLAAREYLQNPSNWQPDGQHHVAKLVTTGTPHGGSNVPTAGFLYGPDGQSEAVRDLRTSYTYSTDYPIPYINNSRGVYLFGGPEDLLYMRDQSCCTFYNADVNCNGIPGQSIQGLNNKTRQTNLDYACIIGTANPLNGGDGVVNNEMADLNNYYPNLTTNIFSVSAIHTALTEKNYENMQGLDEPNEYILGYHIGLDTTYTGFTTVQATSSPYYPTDYDDFKFSIPSDGNLNVSISCSGLSNLSARIVGLNGHTGTSFPSNGSSTINFNGSLSAGDYYFEIFGTPTNQSYLHPYNFTLDFTPCTLPVSAFDIYDIIGNDVYFNNTSANATDYYWDFGDGFATTFSDPYPHTYANIGTYTVILTASNSCGSSTFEQTINLACGGIYAYIYQQTVTPVCQGDVVPLDAYDFPNSGYSYVWIKDGTPIGGLGNASYYDATQNGSYAVEVFANGCSAISNAVDVTVVPIPTANITVTGSTSFCQGGSVVLNASPGNGYTYQWEVDGYIINGATASSYPATQGGTYTVVTDNGCLAESGPVDVTVTPNPLSSFSYNTSGNVAYFSNESFNATTYSWAFGDGTSSNLQSPNHTYLSSGSYNVTLTVTSSGCGSNSSTQTIDICSIAASLTAQSATTFCQGGSVVLSANPSSGYTYQWVKNGINLVNTLSSYTATQNGLYWVVLTGNGCSATSNSITVTTTPNPVSGFTYSTNGNTVSFSNLSSNETGYSWSFGDGNNSSLESPIHTYASSGSYTVTLTVSSPCGSNPSTQIINLNCSTTASISPQSSTTFCQGGSVTLNANTGTGYTYQWKRNGTNVGTLSSYNATQGGFYTLLVTANSCTATSNPLLVTINPLPTPTLTTSGATTFCQGGQVTLSLPVTYTSYGWSNGVINSTQIVSSSGSYTVTVTDNNGCSASSNSIQVVVNQNPTSNAGANQTNTGTGVTIGGSPTANGGQQPYSYSWNPTTGLNGSTVANPFANPLSPTTYFVTVTDVNGCSASANVVVNVTNSCASYSLVSSSVNVPASGGICYANINTDQGCPWSVNAGGCIGWVTVNTPSGIGSDSISFSVDTNVLSSLRTCFASIEGNLFQIIQSAATSTGILAIHEITNISVYPNPNTGTFTVSIESLSNQKLKLNIFNALGQLITKQEIQTGSGISKTDFNLSANAKGMYYLQLQTEGRNHYVKISVE